MRRNTVRKSGLAFALLALAGLAALSPRLSQGADHRDGPRITDLGYSTSSALDLNDLFIFVSPTNRNNTVFVLDMSPAAGVVGPATFFPGAGYELKISNDGDPLDDELIFQTTFSPPNGAGQQNFEIRLFRPTGSPTLIGRGTTNGKPARLSGGFGTATAGIFDDPFFFDVNAVARLNREATILALNRTSTFPLPPDITLATNPARHLLPPAVPNNFFGGFNTLSIVIEVPRRRIQSSSSNPNITAYGSTFADVGDGRGYAQFDRVGLPGTNTVIVPLTRTSAGEILPGGFQDQFNFLTPAGDISLRPVAEQRLIDVFGLPEATAESLAELFLPDVARFNTTSTAGFPNGRRLRDDVIDTELSLLTQGALPLGDRVPSDSYFRRRFPYVGPPNPITDELP